MRLRLPLLLVLSTSAIVACSDEAPLTAPSDVTLEEALDELNTVGTYAGAGLTTVGISAPEASVPASTVCPLDAATMFFICPERTNNGLTANRRYQLLDASGTPVASFDPATVRGIRNIVAVTGTRTGAGGDPTRTISIDMHDEQVLTGLGTSTRVINSSGTSEMAVTQNGETRTLSSTHTITNLVLPAVPGPNTYPSSGTVTTTGTSDLGTYTTTMTFNGTSTVTIVTTANGDTWTCTMDLQAPGTAPVCS